MVSGRRSPRGHLFIKKEEAILEQWILWQIMHSKQIQSLSFPGQTIERVQFRCGTTVTK